MRKPVRQPTPGPWPDRADGAVVPDYCGEYRSCCIVHAAALYHADALERAVTAMHTERDRHRRAERAIATLGPPA